MDNSNEMLELARKQEKRAKQWDNAVTAGGCVFAIPLVLIIVILILIFT